MYYFPLQKYTCTSPFGGGGGGGGGLQTDFKGGSREELTGTAPHVVSANFQ